MTTSIYYLSDGDGPVRYVGKTSATLGARLNQHKSHSKRERNHRAHWIRSAKDLRIELIEVVEGDGIKEEVYLIAALKALGASLVNGTQGGEGTVGHRHSAETRKKMSESRRRRPPHSAETRRKMSETRTGRKASEETRKKISEARRRQPPPTAETRRKISATLKARSAKPGGHNG